MATTRGADVGEAYAFVASVSEQHARSFVLALVAYSGIKAFAPDCCALMSLELLEGTLGPDRVAVQLLHGPTVFFKEKGLLTGHSDNIFNKYRDWCSSMLPTAAVAARNFFHFCVRKNT